MISLLRRLNFALITTFLLGMTLFPSPAQESRRDLDEIRRRVLPRLQSAAAENKLTVGSPVFLRLFKESKELELWMQSANGKFALFKTWAIATWGPGKLGPKLAEGDLQAPEGFYSVAKKQLNPNSKYHLAFNLGYPNAFDHAHGRTGSYLMVHGSDVSIGCFAMTDAGIEEIYLLVEAALDAGQPAFQVQSLPFRFTPERLEREKANPLLPFWKNLQEGSDAFERDKVPPGISVREKRYLIQPAK